MSRDDIYRIALENGFDLVPYGDAMDLDDRVYQFAQALLYEAGNEIKAPSLEAPHEAPLVARQALAFARGHDWGRHARLEQRADRSGFTQGWQIVGLHDEFTVDGWYFDDCQTIPATVTAARDFGGY